jgi:hypothetical protein
MGAAGALFSGDAAAFAATSLGTWAGGFAEESGETGFDKSLPHGGFEHLVTVVHK